MLESLLTELNSQDDMMREAAVQKARSLPPDQLLCLMNLAAHTSQLRPTYDLASLRERCRFRLFCIQRFLSVLISGNPKTWETIPPFLFVHHLATPVQRSFATLIAEVKDPGFLHVVLALIHQSHNASVLVSPREALKRMLPQMTAEHADALSGAHARILLSFLKVPYLDIELTVCILNALERYGDEGAMPVVSELAAKGFWIDVSSGAYGPQASSNKRRSLMGATYTKRQQVIKAAQECLSSLQRRAAEAKQAQTLLRPSAAAIPSPDALLRPAAPAAGEAVPEELVRPARTKTP